MNVYVLGKSFLQFSSVLNLNLPVVDPSLYIHRYAARLDFSGKMNVVVTSALRVVTRLKKDWIATGRRPDGICAAAIFVAARAHGFPVTQIDLTQLFRISQDMLRHRLEEFKNTPAAQLTLDQLDSHDDNLEFDPPAYIRNIMKEAIDDKKSIIFNDVVISADDLINDDVYKVELSADSDSEASVQSKDDRTHAKAVKRETVDFTFATHNVSVPIPKRKRRKQSQVLGNKIKARGDLYDGLYQQMCGVVENSQSSTGEPKTDCDNLYSEAKNVEETLGARKVNFNKRRLNENKLVVRVALNSTKTGLFSSKSCTTNSDHNNDQEEDMAIAITLTEDEVSNYLLNEEEMSKKKIIWESCYGKFMEERERRKIDREKDSVLNSTDKYTVDGKLRKKYRKKMEQKPSSTSEAVASTGASIKGASKKINYDALKGVFNSDGSFAVPVVGDAASVVSNNSILNRPVTRREPRKNVRTESATSKLRKTAVLLGSAAPTKAVTINTAIPKPQNAVENEKDVKMDDYEDENEEVLMYEDDEMGDNYDYDDDYY